jgi:hypothetical protein
MLAQLMLPLDLNVWIKRTADLLCNKELIEKFSKNSLLRVRAYNFEAAANGIIEAVLFSKKINKEP